MRNFLVAGLLAAGLAPSAGADTSLAINIELEDAEVTTMSYRCPSTGAMRVHYIASEGDTLALVPLDDDLRVFVSVVSASGSRYVAGEFEWWSKGQEATLRNVLTDRIVRECRASN